MHLIAGVSSVGKSTLINSGCGDRFGLSKNSVVIFAHRLTADSGSIKKAGAIHYNLLRPIEYQSCVKNSFDFKEDPAFRVIEKENENIQALIIVASIDNLKKRIEQRELVEPYHSERKYDKDLWLQRIQEVDLPKIYEMFALEMDRLGISCRFLFSHENQEAEFQEIHRFQMRKALEGGKISPIAKDRFLSLTESPEFEYQSINLGFGVSTHGQNRSASILDALDIELRDKSILDVGSAIGSLAFSAEQMGAKRVVGLEPKENRFRAANKIKTLIDSNCDFYQERLQEFQKNQIFDHVFFLNVIHHVPDFIEALSTLSELSHETLTIEFPGLQDSKFLGTYDQKGALESVESPLIGVSSSSEDQTFVFSPEALRRLVINNVGGFYSYHVWQSPMKERFFMRFFKDKNRGFVGPVSADKISKTANEQIVLNISKIKADLIKYVKKRVPPNIKIKLKQWFKRGYNSSD